MPLRLELVAVMGVVDLFRREMLEVDGLARERTDAGRGEHQPGQQFTAIDGRIRRQELAGLFGEVEQDGIAVEHLDAAVVDRRHLGVRVDGEIFRRELVALAGIDRHRLVGEAGFLEEEGDLGRVRRSVEVEFEHLKLPASVVVVKNPAAATVTARRPVHAQILAGDASDEFVRAGVCRHSGASRSDEPGSSRFQVTSNFRVRCFASPRNDRKFGKLQPTAIPERISARSSSIRRRPFLVSTCQKVQPLQASDPWATAPMRWIEPTLSPSMMAPSARTRAP